MCEIDSLASTFVPNLSCGPKGFHFSLKLVFFFFSFLLQTWWILCWLKLFVCLYPAVLETAWDTVPAGILFGWENGTFFPPPVLCLFFFVAVFRSFCSFVGRAGLTFTTPYKAEHLSYPFTGTTWWCLLFNRLKSRKVNLSLSRWFQWFIRVSKPDNHIDFLAECKCLVNSIWKEFVFFVFSFFKHQQRDYLEALKDT